MLGPRVLLQLGTALMASSEAIVARLGEARCAEPGSDEWIDAFRVSEGACGLAARFEALGDLNGAARALEVRRRVVTRALGHRYELVGPAMIDAARMELRLGETDRAIRMCDAVVADFARVMDDVEESAEGPLDEYVLALRALSDALGLRATAGGPTDDILMRRVRAVLEHGEPRP